MKSRIFIASSSTQLDLAYAAQEGLDDDLECTVWSQGVFALSKTTMVSLIDALDENDFGLFILAPDDITIIRDTSSVTVRDNVIFELGLFIGRLGSNRCFIITPKGVKDLHLPTDLLGLTPATFDPDRQDGNLVAALGPACNRIRRAVARLGAVPRLESSKISTEVEPSTSLCSDPDDCISLIRSWMGQRSHSANWDAIRYADVDRELKLVPGSAQSFIEQAARHWGYVTLRKGKDTIMFRESDHY